MSPLRQPRLVRRLRSGEYELKLSEQERQLIGGLVSQMRDLLGDEDDPSTKRLFPTAYPQHEDLDAEYQSLVHDDLVQHHLACLDVVEDTLQAERLEEEQLLAWMGALNDLRLVLGTRLDVSEETDPLDVDPNDPNAGALAVYGYLGWLLEHVIDAVQS